MECVKTQNVSMAILDVMLPDMDGFTLCRKIRENHLFPIIMLTAKVEDVDKITGLTLGADDYITKPFNPLELIARVKTQLRRYIRYNAGEQAPGETDSFDIKGLHISRNNHKCTLNGKELTLTPIEFNILWCLCEHQGNVVSSEELFETVWGEKYLDNNNTVMAHIARLREKMKEPPRRPKYIKTIWGVAISLNHKKILRQYVIALIGFSGGVILLVALAWMACNSVIWQPYDPLYQILHFVEEHFTLFFCIIILSGWAFIGYHFMSKPLRYLDDIIVASAELAKPSEEPIILPDEMKNVQDKLNSIREQALRNAFLAKEAEQRKNDLIVYLAHDLKTPLTSVIGYLTLLQDEPQISSELREKYIGIALDKAERLEDLINEFFDITRFNLTTLTLEVERINLSRMLEQITNEFYPILAEKELTWHTEIPPNVEILCDPDKMERVFDNLIRNAVNYSYFKSVISLSLKPEEESVAIIVKNHGKTIPPDKLNRIFEQFYRIDSSRSSKTGGAGLGLAISKEIIELHGGTIGAESEDESICFTIHLPWDCHKIV